MAERRPVLREIPVANPHSLEESLWPIQIGLVVLGGSLAGIILSICSLRDGPMLHSAWPWLILVGMVIWALLWATPKIEQHIVRRVVMFSIVISLIVNLAILLSLAWADLYSDQQHNQRRLTKHSRDVPEITLPEYVLPPIPDQRQRRDFAQPVEVGAPESQSSEVARQEVHPDLPIDRPQPQPTENPSEPTHRSLRKKLDPAESAPRRGRVSFTVATQSCSATAYESQRRRAPQRIRWRTIHSPTAVREMLRRIRN